MARNTYMTTACSQNLKTNSPFQLYSHKHKTNRTTLSSLHSTPLYPLLLPLPSQQRNNGTPTYFPHSTLRHLLLIPPLPPLRSSLPKPKPRPPAPNVVQKLFRHVQKAHNMELQHRPMHLGRCFLPQEPRLAPRPRRPPPRRLHPAPKLSHRTPSPEPQT